MNVLIKIIIVFLLGLISLRAQNQVSGTIIDENKQPLEFAEITLLTNQSSIVTGVITDKKGMFKFNANRGNYTLQVTYVGQILYSKQITVAEEPINLGVIGVESSRELGEVVVEAKKKLIQQKIDRLVFNVENSSKASQGDALEVLKVTPAIHVQNNRITMIGKSSLQVMVNDKIVQLSDEDLSEFLKSIASEDIKRIEVITTPPAKYEALGNSGLVNIILKQAKKDSWNAQLKSAYRQQRYSTGSLGGNFNFNKNKFSVATSFNYNNGTYYQEQDDYAYFPDGLWYTSSPFKADIKRLNGRIDINYQITSKWAMGGQYLYNNTNFGVTDAPFTPVFDYNTNETLRSLQSDGTMDLRPEIHSLNYNNEVAIDTLGRKIIFNLDYFAYKNLDTKTYDGVSIIKNPFSEQFYRGTNTNKQDVTNVSVKLDIEYPLDRIDLSFGGKISNTNSLNDILFFNSGLVNAPVTNLPLSENDFQYKENIQALYISANKNLSDKWSVKFGLRMEATQTNSKSINLNPSVKNNYTKLFPTFYLSYNATENSMFSFNYSKRIDRPGFFELNPNLYFVNPFQTIEGNAFLQPAFIDNFELINTHKNFITKLYYSYEDNLFSQVPLADTSTNIIRFTNENFINTNRIGFSENYTFNKIKWWSSNNSFDVNYSKSEFNLEEQQEDQKGVNATISTYNDFNVNTDKTLLLGVYFWYSFPGVNGVFNTKSASSLSLSLQYLMLKKDLNISLRGNDIFKSSVERNESRVNGVFQTARYYYDSRWFQLSVSYKFGNKNINAKRHQTGNTEEKGRTGN
ncbi:TonB-dependent receptor [Hyunsoonleella sp. SJ7]|uniref:TonB-dependent receptor n=1 Tax=Hyunsoonleella aquatilis TaxID=2762758 RepID=A0A923HGI1_9FLAO|nr:TonB-dependent receptor [Hyunsoonleella aquatilis]MBC3759868.1 TonB-dependent receptor [Hyunsoonleella aquatilis]